MDMGHYHQLIQARDTTKMLRLIQWLIFGHIHKWNTEKNVPLERDDGAVGTRYLLRCTHCGNVKKKDLI